MNNPGLITPDHPDYEAWEAWYEWAIENLHIVKVSYQRRDIEGQIVKGSVVYRAHHQGLAIDYAAQELTADDDTASFVITSVKAVSR